MQARLNESICLRIRPCLSKRITLVLSIGYVNCYYVRSDFAWNQRDPKKMVLEEDGPGRRWGCRRNLKCTLMDLELGWLPIISDILGCRWMIIDGPLKNGLVL